MTLDELNGAAWTFLSERERRALKALVKGAEDYWPLEEHGKCQPDTSSPITRRGCR